MEQFWINLAIIWLVFFLIIAFILIQHNRTEKKHRVVQVDENVYSLQRLYIWGWEQISESNNRDKLLGRCKTLNQEDRRNKNFIPIILDCN